jgi:hypothetical protein
MTAFWWNMDNIMQIIYRLVAEISEPLYNIESRPLEPFITVVP